MAAEKNRQPFVHNLSFLGRDFFLDLDGRPAFDRAEDDTSIIGIIHEHAVSFLAFAWRIFYGKWAFDVLLQGAFQRLSLETRSEAFVYQR